MDKIEVKLFNTPTVLKNNKKVLFPLRKAEALFYYLVVNKEATRDELAALLFGEHDESSAKKYLRNTLYRLNSAFGTAMVISPQKQVLMLNHEIETLTDLEVFLSEDIGGANAYSGKFLQGFLVKDAENFTEWTRGRADHYKELYIAKLYKFIDEKQGKAPAEDIEHYARLLIQADEFDERGYRVLMNIYSGQGAYNKAINIYNQLIDILDNELGIAPDAKTENLYNQILEMKNIKEPAPTAVPGNFFFGRAPQLKTLLTDYRLFMQSEHPRSIVVIGEAGTGKTKLKEEFTRRIDTSGIYVLETYCYQAEEGYLLKPWSTIFSRVYDIIKKEQLEIPPLWRNIIAYVFPDFNSEQPPLNLNPVEKLDTLKPRVIEDAIMNVLRKVSQKKKILLIFEDLQWIDRMSLSLLRNILLHSGHAGLFFMGTVRNGYGKEMDKFITLLSTYNRLKRMELQRFNRSETDAFISLALPGFPIEARLKKEIYDETEGNPFFIVEILNMIREKGDTHILTPRMQDVLKSRIIDISEEGKKILNICSLFFDEISTDILKQVSGKSEFKIIDILEELKNRFIIKEVTHLNRISYKFTHHKLREFIYSQQSLGKRSILHNKIGLILESRLRNDKRDILVYPRLIHHFSNARNWTATLNYSMKNANVYLDFSHELFPELSDTGIKGDNKIQISREIALNYINHIEELLEKAKTREIPGENVAGLKVRFLHMRGRYLIREGEYEKGVAYIEEVIKDSLRSGDYEYAIKGYIQMAFYSIQTHNVELMKKNLRPAMELAKAHGDQKDIATLLRLKGFNRIMSGCYQEAEKMLNNSINIFSRLDHREGKYSLSIAAAYNYLGEIRRHKRNFTGAGVFYRKAIAISEKKKAFSSLAIFNTNAGQAAFENGDFKTAKEYFSGAMAMYEKFDILWGRSIAEGYSALLLVGDGKYSQAQKCMENADRYAKKLKSPYELELTQKIKAEINERMQQDGIKVKVKK